MKYKPSQEELDLWLKLDHAITQLDVDWMYSDRTKEQREKGQEDEHQIMVITERLQELGWSPSPYVEIKMKVKKQIRLTLEEVQQLVQSPLSGFYDGWRKDV